MLKWHLYFETKPFSTNFAFKKEETYRKTW